MSEWSNVPVLKTGEGHTSGGSNPPLPATSLFNNIQNNPITPLNTSFHQLFIPKRSNYIYGNPSFFTVIFAVRLFTVITFTAKRRIIAMPKKVIPLTNAKISSAKSQDKQLTLSDGDGLRFIVTTKDRKYFRFDYTRPNSKKRNSVTLGDYPGTTLKAAREKRQEYRKMVFEGIDPAEVNKKVYLLTPIQPINPPLNTSKILQISTSF